MLVGVTADPIDIINGLDAPTGMPVDDWDWETILGLIFGAIGLIIVLVILAPILPYVIKGIVWIVVMPFKALAALFKGLGALFKKNKKE